MKDRCFAQEYYNMKCLLFDMNCITDQCLSYGMKCQETSRQKFDRRMF